MRPTFHDFPDDPVCWEPTDDWLLGRDILVASVVHEGAATRSVHLPGGADWRDGWTGDAYAGGQAVTVDAPLARPPFFRRA